MQLNLLTEIEALRAKALLTETRSTAKLLFLSQVIEEEEDDTDFLEEELTIAALLAGAAVGVSSHVLQLLEELDHSRPVTLQAVDYIRQRADGAFFATVADQVTAEAKRAITHGAKAAGNRIDFTEDVVAFRSGMLSHTQYFSDTYLDRVALPSVAERIRALAGDGAEMTWDTLRDRLASKIESPAHWRTTSNVLASRSYHYGLLKSALEAGAITYTYVAVRDERTTEQCSSLDGKQWRVAKAVDLLEQAANAGAEESKNILPFLDSQQVSAMTDDELLQAGVVVPPIHHLCRSTLAIST